MPKPTKVFIEFPSENDVKFNIRMSKEPAPNEGQLELAGRELIAYASALRSERLANQISIRSETIPS